MADIELVIKIPEDLYKATVNGLDVNEIWDLRVAVANGTQLPKGHGDMVDRDAINSRFYDIWKELESYSNKPNYKDLLDKWSMCMDTAQTIIEADKGESEDKE